MKPALLILLICLFPFVLVAQNFEYALTQPEYSGSEISDIAVVDAQVYLAGGLGWCHVPALWTFDTSGQFINHQVLSTPFRYGSVKSLRFDDTTRLFTALLQVSNDLTLRQKSIFIAQLDEDLTPRSEFDFSSISDGPSSKSAMLTDTALRHPNRSRPITF